MEGGPTCCDANGRVEATLYDPGGLVTRTPNDVDFSFFFLLSNLFSPQPPSFDFSIGQVSLRGQIRWHDRCSQWVCPKSVLLRMFDRFNRHRFQSLKLSKLIADI